MLSFPDWGEGLDFNKTTTQSIPPSKQEWPRENSLKVQSLELNPVEHLWGDLKMMAVYNSPSNLAELE